MQLELLQNGPPELTAFGACYFCRTAPPLIPWVKTGVLVEYEGEILICWECARQIGAIAGMVEQESADSLREHAHELEDTLAAYERKVAAYDFMAAHFAPEHTYDV